MFKSQISKYHTLAVDAAMNLNSLERYKEDKDLYSGKSEIQAIPVQRDSTYHRYLNLKTTLTRSDSNALLNYAIGVGFSQFADLNYNTIKAILVNYQDYSLSTNFWYNPSERFYMGVGLNYLGNSYFGNNILPRAHLKYRIFNNVDLSAAYTTSSLYPLISQVFYGGGLAYPFAESVSVAPRNLLLQTGVYHFGDLSIQTKGGQWRGAFGLMLGELRSAVRFDPVNASYDNLGREQSFVNYFKLEKQGGSLQARTIFALVGRDDHGELNNTFQFTPEFNNKHHVGDDPWDEIVCGS